jgi:hypothetical protein
VDFSFNQPYLVIAYLKTLGVLVLHRVPISNDWITPLSLLNLRVLYLHYVPIGEGGHVSYSIFLPETLEQFHIILDQLVTADITFPLPKTLKNLAARFGPTKAPYRRPLKFEGNNAISLTTM